MVKRREAAEEQLRWRRRRTVQRCFSRRRETDEFSTPATSQAERHSGARRERERAIERAREGEGPPRDDRGEKVKGVCQRSQTSVSSSSFFYPGLRCCSIVQSIIQCPVKLTRKRTEAPKPAKFSLTDISSSNRSLCPALPVVLQKFFAASSCSVVFQRVS